MLKVKVEMDGNFFVQANVILKKLAFKAISTVQKKYY